MYDSIIELEHVQCKSQSDGTEHKEREIQVCSHSIEEIRVKHVVVAKHQCIIHANGKGRTSVKSHEGSKSRNTVRFLGNVISN